MAAWMNGQVAGVDTQTGVDRTPDRKAEDTG
jgi:hypothetical protein